MQRFKAFLKINHGLGKVTVANHAKAVNKFIDETRQIFPSENSVIGYLAGLRGGNPSHSHLKNTSRALWWFLKFYGVNLRVKNPKRPKIQVSETLSRAEIARLFLKCGTPKDSALIMLLVCTGVRTKELRKLTVKDLNLKKSALFISQGKNFTDREICVTPECAKAVKVFLRGQNKRPKDYLFGEGTKKPLSLEYLRALFRKLETLAKINKRLHVYLFRHSLATNLLMNGADILTVQRQLGHKDPRTTLSYINYTDKLFRAQYKKYMPKF